MYIVNTTRKNQHHSRNPAASVSIASTYTGVKHRNASHLPADRLNTVADVAFGCCMFANNISFAMPYTWALTLSTTCLLLSSPARLKTASPSLCKK
jgi:hypothetical protein